MLSRIADSLFWLSRYMERADGLVRMIRTNYILSLDKGINGSSLTWRPLLKIFTHIDEEQIINLENDTDAALQLLMTDTDNLNSLKIILTRARENARGVQDHITKEVWEQVNQMYHVINHSYLPEKLTGEALKTIENFSRNSLLFTGIIDTTMPRGIGWNFMNLGRYLERSLHTIEITDKQYFNVEYDVNNQQDILQWRYLLFSLSGYELHLKTYRTSNYSRNVLHQVLMNPDFTRSLIYSLTRIERYLAAIMFEDRSSQENETLSRFFGRLYSSVKFVNFDALNRDALQKFLMNVRYEITEFGKRLAQNFFSYS